MPRRKKTKREQESGLVEYKASLGKNPVTGKAVRKSFYGKDMIEAKEKADEYRLALRMGTLDKEKIRSMYRHFLTPRKITPSTPLKRCGGPSTASLRAPWTTN